MNTPRPSSRNQPLNGPSQHAPPRRAKVASVAQMDLSSLQQKTTSTTPSHSGRAHVSTAHTTPPPRPSVRVRSSNSVATTTSFRSLNDGHTGGGSVTSDDGTVSEDSDRAGDEMHLFSGGQAGVGGGIHLPFGTTGRQTSAAGSLHGYNTMSGPKMANSAARSRTTSSTVGLSNGNSGGASKPMRMAAGASIKVDSALHPGTMTSPGASGPSSLPSLGRNEGSVVSMTSSTVSNANNPHHPTIRTSRSTPSAVTSSKQAEENRRAEEAARTRRKIADLEISNASLLSINSSLEATIRKQASEVQELKMRMQSAHYGDLGVSAADIALAQSVEAIELTEVEKQDDLIFKRLCLSIEQMVFEGKQALDQSTKPTGVKVLSSFDMYEKEIEAENEEELEDAGNLSIMGEDDQSFSIEVIDPDEHYDGHEEIFVNVSGRVSLDKRTTDHEPLDEYFVPPSGPLSLPPTLISTNALDAHLTMVT